jgi:hypothetical protein
MTNEYHRAPVLRHPGHLAKALFLKGITHREDFIHNEDLVKFAALQSSACTYPWVSLTGVSKISRSARILIDFHDFVAPHTENRAIEYIFTAC